MNSSGLNNRCLALALLSITLLLFSLQRVIWAQATTSTSDRVRSNVISVKRDAVTPLYGTKTASTEGDISRQNGDFLKWQGRGQLTWNISVPASGDYEVQICYAAPTAASGTVVDVARGNSRISVRFEGTKGYFGSPYVDYERVVLPGKVKLVAGQQVIVMRIEDPKAEPAMHFRSLELVPVHAKPALEAEHEKARKSRASTEWLAKAGYGVMFHWTSQTVAQDGTRKSYAEAVRNFDVDAFVEMVSSMGAAYVLFTVGHAEPYCPAPIKAWQKYHPGMTIQRDLIMEMADKLNAKGIKLMCYFPTHVVAKAFRGDDQEFEQINREVMTEFGERYGRKIVGYWFDGWYQSFERHPNVSFEDFFHACKAGNPDRIIALNSWIYPKLTEWQEYWAGEVASPVAPPKDQYFDYGPATGLQYQALLIMEPYWVQEKAEMPDPRFSAEKLSEYIRACMLHGGAVTVNLGIYQDGRVGTKALEIMREVRKLVRGKP